MRAIPLPEIDGAGARQRLAGLRARLLLQLSNPKIMVFFGSIFLSILPQDLPAWMQAACWPRGLRRVHLVRAACPDVLGRTARAFYRRQNSGWTDHGRRAGASWLAPRPVRPLDSAPFEREQGKCVSITIAMPT
jgi:threonine/homoserine/homoserine lactone efflux protein